MLPRNTSIFTAEVTAIDLALETIAESDDDHFIIFFDSLSVLLSLHNKKMDNPFILQHLQKLHYMSCAHKTIHLCWIPSHIGIRGNGAADMAAKESLDQDITISQVPYTDLKSHINILFQGNGRSVGRLAVTINFFKLSLHLVNGLLDLRDLVNRKLFCRG